MKRLPILVLILVAAIVPMVSGCGTPNVTMTIEGSSDATAQGLIDSAELALANIHVHATTDDSEHVIVATSTFDIVKAIQGQEVQVFAGKLPAGTYTDLTMTFVNLTVDGDLGSLLYSFPANTTAVFPVNIEVTDDGTVNLTWDVNCTFVAAYTGGSFSAYGSVTIN